jgi:hypothetical protein
MNTQAKDAVALLISEHDKVKQLFREYEHCDASHQGVKTDIAHQICLELTIHTQIEEEIFYPAVRAELHEEQMVDEALQEHAEAKQMIERLRVMQLGDTGMDGLVAQLRKAIEHHVREEEGEMFPKARASDLDLTEMCAQLCDRKEELEHEMGAVPLRNNAASEAAGEQSAVGQAGA